MEIKEINENIATLTEAIDRAKSSAKVLAGAYRDLIKHLEQARELYLEARKNGNIDEEKLVMHDEEVARLEAKLFLE